MESSALIPYTSREGREIVLRHQNALVVRDPNSQRLEIRGLSLTECPSCHRPWPTRSTSPERQVDTPVREESYIDPDYFRMLRASFEDHNDHQPVPSSPIRRLTQPSLRIAASATVEDEDDVQEAEFITSNPVSQEGARIRRDAFSPNYYSQFFREERELGRGGKGVVMLVRHQLDRLSLGYFACKRVPVGDDHAWLEKVLIEVQLLVNLSHPNLVSYRHAWLEDYQPPHFGPSVACCFILQQYCNGGDLQRYVVGEAPKETTKEQLKAQMRRRSKGHTERPQDLFSTQRKLPFDEIYSLFRDIVSGLAYLHDHNYIHRDLKPSNCLLNHEGQKMTSLISDFGEVQPENAVRKSSGTTGTISYCAPEVLKQDASGRYGNFTTKSDVFSLGMILYFLCFSRLPYRNANVLQEELEDIDLLRAEIADWKGFQEERRERPDLPRETYQLLKRMLSIEPNDRPSATDVLNAMNKEPGLLRRESRSASPPHAYHNRRIQHFDSSLPLSTPVPDPQKQQQVHHMFPEDEHETVDASSNSALQITTRKAPTSPSPRLRAHAMTLSRSSEGHDHTSPDRGRSPKSLRHDPSPPLLMAPPTTFWGEIRHRCVVLQHRTMQFYQANTGTVLAFSRLGIFMAKMVVQSNMCWPYMMAPRIGGPLLLIAAMDLAMPQGTSSTDAHAGGRNGVAGSRPFWDWRVSLFLLVGHFSVLWAVRRFSMLCGAPLFDF